MLQGPTKARMLICYYSRTGHTQHMAEAIGEAAEEVAGLSVEVKPLSEVDAGDFLSFDAVVLGSPTYYGSMAGEVKHIIDESVAFHGGLSGKVGGAFASSANIGGGNETTIMDILKAMLIHGMIIQGASAGDHYGPVAVGAVDHRSQTQCANYGRLLGELTVRLHGK